MLEWAQLEGVLPHLVHDLTNGSSCLQNRVTIYVRDGDVSRIIEINTGVGRAHGFTVRRIGPSLTGLEMISQSPHQVNLK